MNKPIPFGKYYLLERINVGGMAEVFKAKAFGVEGFERLVAVKRILPNIAEDEEFITMFIDEAKIAVQLQHANIAQIFDLGKVDDSYFIALEYVYGRDLRAIFDHLRKSGDKMPTVQACYIVMQVCEGLDYAHNKRDSQGRELNLVHRDVSPQNVLIGYDGEIKLVDFGIAKAAGKASKTQAGILKGKFGYMSPEQVRGLPVDRRSDIFALGIVLYELLTSERLFVGESDFSTLEKVRNVEILPPSSFNKQIPPELERIILKALAKDVEDRYQNAIDLHDDLQAFLYSVGEFYSRKDLAAWMKKIFVSELAEETAKNAAFERLEEPTPPPTPAATLRPGTRPAPAPLEWDDEELETQIFDKPPHEVEASFSDQEPEDERELSSADIYLTAEGDDQTIAGAPPELLFGQDVGSSGLSQSGSRPFGGPPPGLSAYRQGASGAHSFPGAGGPRSAAHPSNGMAGMGSGPSSGGGAPLKQTLIGVGAPLGGAGAIPGALPRPTGSSSTSSGPMGSLPGTPSESASNELLRHSSAYPGVAPGGPASLPGRRPLESFASRGKRRFLPILMTLAVLGGVAFGLTRVVGREGTLQIHVQPADSVVAVDQVPLKGSSPFTAERSAGKYTLSFSRDGYLKQQRVVELEAGQTQRVDVQLEPAGETGFELTSDPSGALVWLDGKPVASKDPSNPQARTNFKAFPISPGPHVLEIKGDARFEDWRYEFYQQPGKILAIHAVLQPRKPASPTKPARAPEPRPAETAEAEPAPAATSAPAAPATEDPAAPPRTDPPPVRRPTPRPARAATEDGAPARSEARCLVTIGSRPWAEVWLDGKNTGQVTPLVDFEVPCGRHKLTLKNGDLGIEKSETLTVRSGEKWKKVYRLVDGDE